MNGLGLRGEGELELDRGEPAETAATVVVGVLDPVDGGVAELAAMAR